MRKLFLTTALVLPLATGHAFAQDTAPQATDAETAPMAMDPAANDMATDPAADEAAAKEAMAAEVADSGKIARQQAGNELRLDWITDATVTSPDGAAIGDINDLILDGESGRMIAAIIGVGGFLGIGEKQIAVPWDQLSVNYDAQEIMSELSEEEAEAAPEYVFRDRDSAPDVLPAAGMETDAAESTMAPAAPAADPAAMPADDMPEDTMPAADAAAPMEGDAAMEGHDAMPAEGMEGDMDKTSMEAEPAMEGGMADEKQPATD